VMQQWMPSPHMTAGFEGGAGRTGASWQSGMNLQAEMLPRAQLAQMSPAELELWAGMPPAAPPQVTNSMRAPTGVTRQTTPLPDIRPTSAAVRGPQMSLPGVRDKRPQLGPVQAKSARGRFDDPLDYSVEIYGDPQQGWTYDNPEKRYHRNQLQFAPPKFDDYGKAQQHAVKTGYRVKERGK